MDAGNVAATRAATGFSERDTHQEGKAHVIQSIKGWDDKAFVKVEPTRAEQRAAGDAQKKKRFRLHAVKEIPKANYAVSVLGSMDALRSIMVHRHNPERVQQIAKEALSEIYENMK